ncbi:unnamed protein product [Ectocarpus sp. 13 AM-2016]
MVSIVGLRGVRWGGGVLVCSGGRSGSPAEPEGRRADLIVDRCQVGMFMGRVTLSALHVRTTCRRVITYRRGFAFHRLQRGTPLLSKSCRSLPESSCSFGATAILMDDCRIFVSNSVLRTSSIFHRPGASAREMNVDFFHRKPMTRQRFGVVGPPRRLGHKERLAEIFAAHMYARHMSHSVLGEGVIYPLVRVCWIGWLICGVC